MDQEKFDKIFDVPWYILKGKEVVKASTVFEWGTYMEYENRRVNETILPDGVRVSTVFLGLDHGWDDGEPLVFETMVFGGEHDQYLRRYSTWEQAERGHQETIKMIFEI